MASVLAATIFFNAVAAHGLPAVSARQSITALTTTQIDYFTPYTYYASTGYCTSSQTSTWNCGANCNANPHFRPVASGGDGDSVQYWYVGYDPNLDTVIVAHQGTNFQEIMPLATDANLVQENLNPALFPRISSSIKVHSGFADEHAKTATNVLDAVKRTMANYDTTSVAMVGHSLGAALALLDSVYLPLWLPSGTTFQTIGYGLPRVGNQAFANYVDAHLHLTHINNKKDPVPIVPGTSLGYVHPTGEVHIEDSGEWAVCPGRDNPSKECIVGDVPIVVEGNISDHYGPYNGIEIGCSV